MSNPKVKTVKGKRRLPKHEALDQFIRQNKTHYLLGNQSPTRALQDIIDDEERKLTRLFEELWARPDTFYNIRGR